jgi:hypothetical protein
MSFTSFATGHVHTFGGTYVELVPHERIRYTDRFDDPNLPGEIQVTISLKRVSCGTELHITQEGVPAAIPAEMCYLGWQESLNLLALLVEGLSEPLPRKRQPRRTRQGPSNRSSRSQAPRSKRRTTTIWQWICQRPPSGRR